MDFSEAGLPDYILAALGALNITKMTDVQQKVLPPLREGKDVAFRSATGSGKTFCYAIPAVENIHPEDPAVQVLVLCPTRELCMQITGEFRKLCVKKEGCRAVSLYGGTGMQQQIYDLKKGARIVVGTPGRILDHLARRVLKLGGVRYLVIDEADEMLSMGFEKDLREIVSKVNPHRQTVLCSATMPERVRAMVNDFMTEPVYLESEEDRPAVDFYYSAVGVKQKFAALLEVLGTEKPHTSIVFCNTKRMADGLKEKLSAAGIDALALHGDLPQPKRKEVFDEMRSRGGILVATDVAARGIDLSAVDLIVSYDLPDNAELFTHRAGRTARAGKSGKSFTLVNTTLQRERLAGFFAETGNSGTYYALSTVDNYGKPEKDSAFRTEADQRFDRQDFGSLSDAEVRNERSDFRPERPKNERRIAKSGHFDGRGDRDFGKRKGGFRKESGRGFDRKRDGAFARGGKEDKFSRGGKFDRNKKYDRNGKPVYGKKFDHDEAQGYGKNFDRAEKQGYGKKFDHSENRGYGKKSGYSDNAYGKKSGYSDSGYGKKTSGDVYGAKTGAGKKSDFRGAGKSDYADKKPDFRNAGKSGYADKKSNYRGADRKSDSRAANSRTADKKSNYRDAGKSDYRSTGKADYTGKKPAFRGAGTPSRKPFKKG